MSWYGKKGGLPRNFYRSYKWHAYKFEFSTVSYKMETSNICLPKCRNHTHISGFSLGVHHNCKIKRPDFMERATTFLDTFHYNKLIIKPPLDFELMLTRARNTFVEECIDNHRHAVFGLRGYMFRSTLRIVRLLLKAGADASQRTSSGKTALDFLEESHEMVHMIRTLGLGKTAQKWVKFEWFESPTVFTVASCFIDGNLERMLRLKMDNEDVARIFRF